MKCYLCIFLILFFSTLNFTKSAHINLSEESDLKGSGCVCSGFTCGCCIHVESSEIGLNDTACVNITYLPKEYGIHFTLNIDKLFIYNETISVRNPPPLCAGAPILKDFAELCIHFYDLDATLTKLHGCVDLEGRLRKIVVAKYKLGCFNLGGSSGNLEKWKKLQSQLIAKILAVEKKSRFSF